MSNLENYIKEHFNYDSITGEITRNDRKDSFGSYDKDGYLIIKIKKQQFKSHRLAWFLYYGFFPKTELDHINRIRTDNRISNLRLANRFINTNNVNRKINKETGVIGVYEDHTNGLKKKFTFKHKNKTYRFYTLNEAQSKRNEIKNKYYEEINCNSK